jgi:D-alanyl-D-alanine carboxypeptidase
VIKAVAVGLVLVALLGVRPAGSATTPFRETMQLIDAAQARRMTGVSWRPGCPVPLRDLRLLTLSHWGFDGRIHTGRLIVHRDVAHPIVGVFRSLYAARFPIRRMVPVDTYGGSDFRSIEADNTSAFNCRPVEGTTRWSEHAYGRAIDVNPIENPYVSGGRTSHAASRPYVDRARRRPGMAYQGGALVRAFDRIGWGWGGRWTSVEDYQHFSASGR